MAKIFNSTNLGGFVLAAIIVLLLLVLITIRPTKDIDKPSNTETSSITVANEVAMRLISAHTEASRYRVEVCYDLPNQQGWQLTYPGQPQGVVLSVADIKAHPVEEGTMYWRYDENEKITQRCEFLLFAVKIPAHAQEISLDIEKLYTRESGQSDYCLEVSQEMAERNYSITIDCVKMDAFDETVYLQFPTELLSIDPVFKKIFKDVTWEFYRGPWSFTFPVNPQ